LTPETSLFLAKARRLLAEAEGMLTTMHYNEAAGRTAYLAGFHAAQALISDSTGRAVKTHKGVRTEFHRVIHGDFRFDDTLRQFLGSTYNLKAIADYETGPDSDVSPERAARAISEAGLLIAAVAEVLAGSYPLGATPPGINEPPTDTAG
jgi:uncharacterized protein (UPF0332 family)